MTNKKEIMENEMKNCEQKGVEIQRRRGNNFKKISKNSIPVSRNTKLTNIILPNMNFNSNVTYLYVKIGGFEFKSTSSLTVLQYLSIVAR